MRPALEQNDQFRAQIAHLHVRPRPPPQNSFGSNHSNSTHSSSTHSSQSQPHQRYPLVQYRPRQIIPVQNYGPLRPPFPHFIPQNFIPPNLNSAQYRRVLESVEHQARINWERMHQLAPVEYVQGNIQNVQRRLSIAIPYGFKPPDIRPHYQIQQMSLTPSIQNQFKIHQLPPIEYVQDPPNRTPPRQLALTQQPNNSTDHPNTQYPIRRFIQALEKGKTQLESKFNQITPIEQLQTNIQNAQKRATNSLPIPQQLRNTTQVKRKIRSKLTGDVTKNHIKRNLVIGTALLFLSSFMIVNQNHLIRVGINYAMILTPDGIVQYFAQNPPTFITAQACAYLFGFNNPQEAIEGAKPDLQEIGPFCFYIYPKLKILQWKGETVKFRFNLRLVYNPTDSLPLDTQIKLVNLPIIAVMLIAQSAMRNFYVGFIGPAVYNVAYLALRASGEPLIEEIPVSDYLIGRKVPIIRIADRLLFRPLRAIGIPIPDPLCIFGVCLNSEHEIGVETTLRLSWLGPVEVFLRTENGHTMGEFHSVLGGPFAFSMREECKIQDSGNIGIFLKRPITEDKLRVNLPLVCRQVEFVKEYSHLLSGAWVTRYKLNDKMWEYGNNKRAAECHCHKKTTQECDGWHDASPCIVYVPLGFTMPHFYKSPRPLSRVTGLKPIKKKHSFWMDMDTNIGVPVNGQVAIQIIADVQPITGVPALNKLPYFQYPIFYVKFEGGLVGWMAPVLFIMSNTCRFGNWAWLLGVGCSGLLYYRSYKQWQFQREYDEDDEEYYDEDE